MWHPRKIISQSGRITVFFAQCLANYSGQLDTFWQVLLHNRVIFFQWLHDGDFYNYIIWCWCFFYFLKCFFVLFNVILLLLLKRKTYKITNMTHFSWPKSAFPEQSECFVAVLLTLFDSYWRCFLLEWILSFNVFYACFKCFFIKVKNTFFMFFLNLQINVFNIYGFA